MSKRYGSFRSSTAISVGWLFADLLLALAMLFLLANTVGNPRIPEPIPILTVDQVSLDPTSAQCTGGISHPRCTVEVGEAASSKGQMKWSASSDISTNVTFSPASGILSPGGKTTVTITAIMCQNGSFTFSGSRKASPVTIAWHCTPPPERLNFKFQEFTLVVHDITGLLSDSPSAINDVEQQVRSQSILQGSSVGLAIVYDGAPNDALIGQAQTVAEKVYGVLGRLGREGFAFQRSSYYVPLYSLGVDLSTVQIDVYLFTR